MKALLSFDTLVTPKIIVVIYYLLLLLVLVGGLATIFAAGQPLQGILAIVVGGLGVRVYCEICIIFFKMNEALQELRKK